MVITGCGSSASTNRAGPAASISPTPQTASGATTTPTAREQARPQVVEPVAGEVRPSRPGRRLGQPDTVTSPAHDPAPTAPASDTRAPANGAPSDAEVHAEIARFKLAIARYHLDRLNLSDALLDPSQLPFGQYNTSIASVYTDYGLPIACGGVLHVPQLGVANKTLPCGTEVIFRYGGRAIRVPVIDRGPYVAGREWDLTGAAAEALHFPGLGPIEWRLA